jgi:hypothetical protein
MWLDISDAEGTEMPDRSSQDMPTNETEIELIARAMIDRHGVDAAKSAVIRLNQMIDRGDWIGRDRWACVVRTIHERQGVGPVFGHGEPANVSTAEFRRPLADFH